MMTICDHKWKEDRFVCEKCGMSRKVLADSIAGKLAMGHTFIVLTSKFDNLELIYPDW